MLAARALGRAAAQEARCSASLTASGASAALTESAGAGKGRWSEYSRALARLGQGGPLGSWRDDKERSKADGAKGLHTGEAWQTPGSGTVQPGAAAPPGAGAGARVRVSARGRLFPSVT